MTDSVEVTQAEISAALSTFNGGLVRETDERFARGYTTHYHPGDSMRAVLEEFARHRIASEQSRVGERLREAFVEGYGCAVPDCVGNWLDVHDADQARAYYRKLAIAALGDGK